MSQEFWAGVYIIDYVNGSYVSEFTQSNVCEFRIFRGVSLNISI